MTILIILALMICFIFIYVYYRGIEGSKHNTSIVDRFGYQWGDPENVIIKNGKKCQKTSITRNTRKSL